MQGCKLSDNARSHSQNDASLQIIFFNEIFESHQWLIEQLSMNLTIVLKRKEMDDISMPSLHLPSAINKTNSRMQTFENAI